MYLHSAGVLALQSEFCGSFTSQFYRDNLYCSLQYYTTSEVPMCIIVEVMLHVFTTQFLDPRIIYLVDDHNTVKCFDTRQSDKGQTSRKFSFSQTKFDPFEG